MRREKTLTVCANHYINAAMELKPNLGSDRSWVYTCPADFSEDEVKVETFAVRLQNTEKAKEFKDQFEACQKKLPAQKSEHSDDEEDKKEESEDKK